MNVFMIIYIISVSCQLSGSVLLLLKYCFVNIQKEIAANKEKETNVKEETMLLAHTQPTPTEYKENVGLNRVAFALLAFGYLISVFGKIDDNQRWLALLFIIVLSGGITFILYYALTKKSNDKAG